MIYSLHEKIDGYMKQHRYVDSDDTYDNITNDIAYITVLCGEIIRAEEKLSLLNELYNNL